MTLVVLKRRKLKVRLIENKLYIGNQAWCASQFKTALYTALNKPGVRVGLNHIMFTALNGGVDFGLTRILDAEAKVILDALKDFPLVKHLPSTPLRYGVREAA